MQSRIPLLAVSACPVCTGGSSLASGAPLCQSSSPPLSEPTASWWWTNSGVCVCVCVCVCGGGGGAAPLLTLLLLFYSGHPTTLLQAHTHTSCSSLVSFCSLALAWSTVFLNWRSSASSRPTSDVFSATSPSIFASSSSALVSRAWDSLSWPLTSSSSQPRSASWVYIKLLCVCVCVCVCTAVGHRYSFQCNLASINFVGGGGGLGGAWEVSPPPPSPSQHVHGMNVIPWVVVSFSRPALWCWSPVSLSQPRPPMYAELCQQDLLLVEGRLDLTPACAGFDCETIDFALYKLMQQFKLLLATFTNFYYSYNFY